MALPITFNLFVHHIQNNTLPFVLDLSWLNDNAQHLKYYTTDDFLEVYMDYFDVQENRAFSDYDDAMEYNAEEIDKREMEKWLDMSDMSKDTETFGYSDYMYNLSYDAW